MRHTMEPYDMSGEDIKCPESARQLNFYTFFRDRLTNIIENKKSSAKLKQYPN